MESLTNIVTMAIISAHLAIWGFAAARTRRRDTPAFRWLSAALLLAGLSVALALLPADWLLLGRIGGGLLALLCLTLSLAAFGALVILDMRAPRLRVWLGLMAVWLAALVLAAMLSPTVSIGQAGWLTDDVLPDAPGVAAFAGLLVATTVLVGGGFYLFYHAPLAEVANRALYWVLTASVLVMAYVLVASGTPTLLLMGHLAVLTAGVGMVYGFLHHRVFDIRGSLIRTLITLLLMSFTGVLLFVTLYAVTGLDVNRQPENIVVLGILALALSIIFVPVRQVSDVLFERAFRLRALDNAQVTREYSHAVAQAVELEDIVQAATTTLQRAMGIRRSGLMLISSTGERGGPVELTAIPGGIFTPEQKGLRLRLSSSGALYHTLAADQRAVAQFDLDYSARYAEMAAEERAFFQSLHMNAYAPVIMDNVFVGLMLFGAKPNDAAYTLRDLELLTILAQQIGLALRNARLLDDLQHLNASMRSLNRGLEQANQTLERLDSVKTDFVTIASHELRTPLAQIRGYTDMIDAVNEQGMLDQEQAASMVSNLRKATERMEELIAAMLDVSQLDVAAMDLRFTQTTPETVLRLAIEPLTDAIKQRKLNLSARWRGLPPIKADLQRLVQAFRNVIVNAIKFTPDGGHIEIVASLQPARNERDVDHILVTIRDTGVGIDKAHLELIFKKFYRTYDPQLHSTGTYKFLGAGPGLGLTIAKGMIEAHGGKIWAESDGHSLEDLPGTTIYVLLPVSISDEAARSVSIDSGDSSAVAASARPG